MGPIHLYGKNVDNFNSFSSEASGPVLLKFYAEPLWAGERKIAKIGYGPLIKMAAMPIYGKNL